MDFNNINLRLERLYSSLDARYDADVPKHLNLKQIPGASNSIHISFDKGMNQSDAMNKIIIIVHNLANLKDNLKNFLKTKGKEAQCVEEKIDNSIFLQIAIDLSNQEKHGYPLTIRKRSKKDPKIKDVKQVLSMTSTGLGTVSSFQFNPSTGEAKIQGNAKTAIVADIVDSAGALIFSLDDFINGAIISWEEFIKEQNIVLTSQCSV